jgi:hypothetical protein
MAVQITIDQSGKPAGVAGKAREDLAVAVAAVLQATGGFSQYQWSIIDSPPNATLTAASGATLTTPTSQSTNLTPDNDGTYLVRVEVDAGYGLGARDEDVAEITFYAGAALNATISELPRRIPSAFEQLHHNIDTPAQPTGSTIGWAWEWLKWFKVVERIDSELLALPTGGDDYHAAFALLGDLAYATGVTFPGQTAVLADDYVAVGTIVAYISSVGTFRGSYNTGLWGYFDSADHRIIHDSSGNILVGDSTLTSSIQHGVKGAGYHMWWLGASAAVYLDASAFAVQSIPIIGATYFATASAAGSGEFRGGTDVALYGIKAGTPDQDMPVVALSNGVVTLGHATLCPAVQHRVAAGGQHDWYEATTANLLVQFTRARGIAAHADGESSKYVHLDAQSTLCLLEPSDMGDAAALHMDVKGGASNYGFGAGHLRLWAGTRATSEVQVLKSNGDQIVSFGSDTSTNVGMSIHRIGAAPVARHYWASASSYLIHATDGAGGDANVAITGAYVTLTANGTDNEVTLVVGGSRNVFQALWDGSVRKMLFFGGTPVAQPADPGALTDGTGGSVDGTLAAMTGTYASDYANLNDDLADLAAKYNALRAGLSGTAGGLNLFA